MGVVGSALALLAALAAAAWVTHELEVRLGPDPRAGGPAAPAGGKAALRFPAADQWLYPAAPVLAVMGTALAAVVVPFGRDLIAADLGIGLFYFIVVADFVVVGVALGGWGANTADAVEACYRIVAQLVGYVVPLGLAYIGAIMMAESLSAQAVVEAQSGLWFIVLQPLGFLLYVATGLMQCYRFPFGEPFAVDVRGGVLPAFGGWQALGWRLALDGLLFLVAAMGAVLFLGGWQGPWLPGPVWMLLKSFALVLLFLWLGRRLPPLGTARLLELSWKILIPIGLVNVLIVGALILVGVNGR